MPHTQATTGFARPRLVLAAGMVALLLNCLLALSVGPYDVMAALFRPAGDPATQATAQAVLLNIRLPRVVLGILAGAALATGGCVMQALFRNPLAEPGLLGISSGAALGASAALVLLGGSASLLGGLVVPVAAFAGALLVAWIVMAVAASQGAPRVASMLLAGLAVNAVAGAGLGLLATLADDSALRSVMFWLFGSLGKAEWQAIAVACPLILAAVLMPLWRARQIDALTLGEAEAFHLGVNVAALKWWLLGSVILGVGMSVALTGVIGFIGLVVPHLLRLIIGHANRALILCSSVWGASLLLAADTVGRIAFAPAELPVGIVTALLGGPFFILLLARSPNSLSDT